VIPIKTATTTITNTGGTAKAFTMASTGKMFRILIDGIYSNKEEAPVRELMTNAYDAHRMAGKSKVPFQVIVPTMQDPTFGVRDYGVGMDHETIMGLYSEIGGSSKENSNEQVGMLGLGSKSPFAYTDSFTVTAFDGVEKRVYMAYIKDDLPMIEMVGGKPVRSTDPKGIEVRFPVESRDLRTFVDSIKRCAIGFNVAPVFDTDDVIAVAVPHMTGSFWKLYHGESLRNASGRSSAAMVLQGCVVYPVEAGEIVPPIPYGMSLVVEVPIGSVEVATSREALAFDPNTKAVVRTALDTAWNEAKEKVLSSYKSFGSQLEKMKYASELSLEWRRLLPPEAQALLLHTMPESYTPEMMKDIVEKMVPGYYLTTKDKAPVHQFKYSELSRMTVLIDSKDVARHRSRIVQYCRNRSATYIIPVGMDWVASKKILMSTLGLAATQFVHVKDIPDTGTTGVGSRKRTKISEHRTALANGALWVVRNRNQYSVGAVTIRTSLYMNLGMSFIAEVLNDTGFERKLVILTPKEHEVLAPPEAQSYYKTILNFVTDNYVPAIKETYVRDESSTGLNQHAISWQAATAIMRDAYPKPVAPYKMTQQIRQFVSDRDLIDYTGLEKLAEIFIDDQRLKYPMLFKLTDFNVDQYIKDQNSTKTNTKKVTQT
jgi:hypothetical protein